MLNSVEQKKKPSNIDGKFYIVGQNPTKLYKRWLKIMKKMFNIANLEVKSIRKTEVYDEKCKAYREKHTIKITNSDKKCKYFTYTTEVIGYIDRENLLKNAMYCLFMDYGVLSYCRNEEDFIAEFGYDEKTGRKMYKRLYL